ncbi:hypothetical protein EJ03DRAFT_240285, partial [Teratosphaeria nubilosa]
SSSYAASSTSSTSAGLKGGKRGLAYTDIALTECFLDSEQISWGYDWVSGSKGLSDKIQFIPTLHSNAEEWTSVWAKEVAAAISGGSKTVFSFNEPDQAAQANLLPTPAAQAHAANMKDLTNVDVCAPSVSSGQGVDPPMGLDWLLEFKDACSKTDGCKFACINIHWYSTNQYADTFYPHVQNASSLFPGLPIWITEFGITGGTNDQVNSFLTDVMPKLDSDSNVAGYSYY